MYSNCSDSRMTPVCKRKMVAVAAGGVAIMSPGATDDEEPELLDDGGNEGSNRPKRRNTLSIMEMREKNKGPQIILLESMI